MDLITLRVCVKEDKELSLSCLLSELIGTLLIGARVIFWDLRDMFLVQLYNGTVEGARLERLLPHIDTVNKKFITFSDSPLSTKHELTLTNAFAQVLDNVCSLSYEDSRDMVVLSICRSALVTTLLEPFHIFVQVRKLPTY